jgi:hypothetical protein
MKIIKSSGCTAFYTDVDGRELSELTEEEKKALMFRLLKIHNLYGLDSTINMLLDNIEYEGEDGGYCDQCGDSVYRQIYDLDEFNIKENDDSSNRE